MATIALWNSYISPASESWVLGLSWHLSATYCWDRRIALSVHGQSESLEPFDITKGEFVHHWVEEFQSHETAPQGSISAASYLSP